MKHERTLASIINAYAMVIYCTYSALLYRKRKEENDNDHYFSSSKCTAHDIIWWTIYKKSMTNANAMVCYFILYIFTVQCSTVQYSTVKSMKMIMRIQLLSKNFVI